MAWRFRSYLSSLDDPGRATLAVNWPAVRRAFTTRDGGAYLAQIVILFGTIGLMLWMIRDFLIARSWQSLFVAGWLYLLLAWPSIRERIRGR